MSYRKRMNRRHLIFASLLIFVLALGLFLMTKAVQPSPSSTLYGNLLLTAAAIGGAVAFLAGFKDTVELLQAFSSKSEEKKETSDSIQNTISGPVQVVYGNVHHTTVNVTYIVQGTSVQIDTAYVPQPPDSYHRQAVNLAPPPPPHFVGRRAEVETFKQILLRKSETIGLVSQIRGMGGVGKTALVSMVANDPYIQQVFSDGILWASIYHNPNLGETLYHWIKVLEPPAEISQTDDGLKLLDVFRSLVEERKLLIVFDDVSKDTISQVRSIINAVGGDSKVVITSRSLMLPGVQTIVSLDVLPEREALTLLQKLMGRELTHEETSTARELVFLLGYHPLAIGLAGGYLRTCSASLEEYLSKLRETARELEAQDLDTIREKQAVSLQKSLDFAFERLSETDQNRLLLLDTISSEQLHTVDALAAHWSVSYEEGVKTVSNLMQWGLIAKDGDGYRIHPLVQEYARETKSQRKVTE
jgi:hypothetical protein